ncbi:L-threonylcarbamoyladenylate synthase [Actinoplanes campanulatus]|uniref:Threonylcarbamoyl-AMP synthase n=1 Tax=Actinoplanes campanulatus TaxID=113559 RepID=A0A7W5ABK8_9ACTN|nr:L-threonylcarbamoyladenylate synthase [Actinoplanes campanulatus]MBB3093287.1 L-threonylcarbamoyladenylate synthase [Actinoplanes campanulatus]GGN02528.1 threonylcarbamoyl-AMP synthase [Actinoplanes campanulatus]GID33618.1 threonylcarbamoyl-AMP synthase [Actinoplanes campanulatus]
MPIAVIDSAASRIVRPDAEGLARAAEILRTDSVVAFPTETVYGLGANAFSEKAVAEIYRLKNRPTWNPLIVHVPDVAAARELTDEWPALAGDLAARFWPGPLTLVLRRARHLPGIGAANDTVAVRVPAHPIALDLLRASGLPLAAPSANRSEGISPTTAEHVIRSLPDVPLVLDGGTCSWGIESTVLDVTGDVPRLLRPGALGLRVLRDAAGAITLPESETVDGAERPSPGMSRRHYAPRARAILCEAVRDVDRSGLAEPIATLVYEGSDGTEVLSADPREYAADLYAALHRLDDAGFATILIQEPPHTEDWLAVRDRLSRAAA